jgi:hypothetical protein
MWRSLKVKNIDTQIKQFVYIVALEAFSFYITQNNIFLLLTVWIILLI